MGFWLLGTLLDVDGMFETVRQGNDLDVVVVAELERYNVDAAGIATRSKVIVLSGPAVKAWRSGGSQWKV